MSNSRQSATTAFSARLTDAEWAVLQSLIPANRPGGRPPKYARRAVLDAILYVVRRGSRATYDARGRTLTTVENYVDGVPSNLDDKTTEYAYGPAGMTTLTARLAGGGGQTTQWVYGVTAATGSGIDSNDAKGATRWPDPATGLASASQQETVTVNALGQPLTGTDRNGTTHALSYDVLGRVTDDAVTLLGVNVDGAVRRVHADYDGQGNASLLTNYSAATGGAVVSQVQRAFNGLRQLLTEYQAHGAAVSTATTPKVQYAYSALDATNKSRPLSVTYPNGRVVMSDYGTAGQLNDKISRLSALKDGATTLEAYAYLGLGTVVTRSHPQPGLDLTSVKRVGEASGDAGDQYTGMDRFGRVVDQRWVIAATGVAADRFGYTHDRSGNRLTKSNGVNAAFGEAYTYDGLNQLAGFARGAHTQAWDYDSLGNWNGVTTDGVTQTRTANAQNEITAISGAVTPTYDANGNMTTDETGRQFVYDAWNRLKVVKSAGGVVLETLGYDALNRRITSAAAGATTDLYYSSGWQVLEERVGGVARASYVWSPVYVDALVSRDRDADGSSANGLEERLYALADANYNVTALVTVSGVVAERYAYGPFGQAVVLDAAYTVQAGGSGYAWVVLFQGLKQDGVSGLYYARNRDYSPTLGRWVTMDPIRFEGGDINLYRLVGNDPTNRFDPLGLAEQMPGWMAKLAGVPGSAGERGTVMEIKDWHNDKQHKGGAHYDVHFVNEDGHVRKQRFTRDGIPFTEAQNDAITNQPKGNRKGGNGRGRGGSIRSSALIGIGVTTIVVGGTMAVYDVYLERGADGAEKKGEAVFGCRLIRSVLHSGELPEVYDEYGVVRQLSFTMLMNNKLIRVFLEPLPGGGRGIHAVHDGKVLINKCDCPLSGG